LRWPGQKKDSSSQTKEPSEAQTKKAEERELVFQATEGVIPLLLESRQIAWTPHQRTINQHGNRQTRTHRYAGIVLKREDIPTNLAETLTELAEKTKEGWYYFFPDAFRSGGQGGFIEDPYLWDEWIGKYFPGMSVSSIAPIRSLIEQWRNGNNYLIVQFGSNDLPPITESLTPWAGLSHKDIETEKRFTRWAYEELDWDNGNATDKQVVRPKATLKDSFLPARANDLGPGNTANTQPISARIYGPDYLTVAVTEGNPENLSEEIENNFTILHDHIWEAASRNSSVSQKLLPVFPKVFGKVTSEKSNPLHGISLGLEITKFKPFENPTKEDQIVLAAAQWLTKHNWLDKEIHPNITMNPTLGQAGDLLRVRPTVQPALNLLAHTANNMAPTFLSFAGLITIDVLPPHRWGYGKRIEIQFNDQSLDNLPSGWQRWVAISLRMAQRKLLESKIWLPAIDTDLPQNYIEIVGETRAEQEKEKWGIIHAVAQVIEDPKGHLNFEVEPVTGEQTILLIDEPEVHLHPDAMHNIRNWLTGTLREANISAIVATHSPAFMDYTPNEATLTGVAKTFEGKVEIYNCGTDFMTWVTEHGTALGIETFDQLLLYRGFLLVEGPHDEEVLKRYYGKQLAAQRIGIVTLWGIKGKFNIIEAQYLRYTRKPVALLVDNYRGKFIHTPPSDLPRDLPKDISIEIRALSTYTESCKEARIPFEGWGHAAVDIGLALPENAVRRFLEDKEITGTFKDGWAPIEKAVRELRGDGKARKREVQKLLGLHVTKYGYSYDNFIEPVLNEHSRPEDRPSKSLERTMKEIFAWFSSLNQNTN
jgi:hypothetical protein